jgi:hypothetical protein
VLVFAGLMDADDPMMLATTKWFREGPPRKVYRYDADCWQVPSLQHEMSSCEPCYSWNVLHSHQLGDRMRFLEGMYSLLTGMYSRQTQTACETRGGVTGVIGGTLATWMARLAVVDDQLQEGELHVLRMMPVAWLMASGSVFDKMPTEFGPVSIKVCLQDGGETLEVECSAQFKIIPQQIWLHVPPIDGLAAVRLNGRDTGWAVGQERIDITRSIDFALT